MNILYIDHYAGSLGMGMEFRPYQMARHWSKAGDRVVILAASQSHLRSANPVVEKGWKRQRIDGVDYLFFRTPAYKGNGLGRAWNTAAFVGRLTRHASRLSRVFQPDIVIASSTYPFDIYPALRIVRQSGAKLVYEIHDLWPLTPMMLYGYSSLHPMIILMDWAERRAMLDSGLVVSILPGADVYMRERGYDPRKFHYIPNGFHLELEPPSQKTRDAIRLLRDYRRQGRFLVVYAGSMGPANCLEEFVEAAGRMGGAAQFIAVGDGSGKEALQAYARHKMINNLLFLEPVPRNQLQLVLALADCLYLGARKSFLYRYGVGMNKLSDYMMAARPILYCVQAANNPVRESGCGLTVPPENVGALTAAVRVLMGMPLEKRIEMGARGRRYVWRHRNEEELAGRFRKQMLLLLRGNHF